MYLTFDDYKNLGGSANEPTFNQLEPKAEHKINYYTQNRIKKLETIPSEVKEVLTIYIDIFNNTSEKEISSYSNGVESLSYVNKTGEEKEKELYQIAVEYLPITLISGVIES